MKKKRVRPALPGSFCPDLLPRHKGGPANRRLIQTGISSNYGKNKKAKYIYCTATLDAAIWGAEPSLGEGRERIYLVEPTGAIEDDPNLTDKRFPGNPTLSYRSKYPFKVVGEVSAWQGHAPEAVKTMKDGVAKAKEQGIEAIED
jgi:hypothetical protein